MSVIMVVATKLKHGSHARWTSVGQWGLRTSAPAAQVEVFGVELHQLQSLRM